MHMSTAEAAFKIQPTFYTRAADWSTEQQYLIRPSDWLEAPTVASTFVCFFFLLATTGCIFIINRFVYILYIECRVLFMDANVTL